MFDLVNTGRVDAFIVSLDTAMLLQATRPEAVVYDPNDAISAGSQIYATSTATAADPAEQDKLRRYLAAIADATAFIAADEAAGFTETMQLIGSKYQVSTLDWPEVARAALAAYVDGYARGPGPDRHRPAALAGHLRRGLLGRSGPRRPGPGAVARRRPHGTEGTR